MPPCTLFSYDPEPSEIFEYAKIPVSGDWSGKNIPFEFSFFFAVSPRAVFFGADIARICTSLSQSRTGEFTPGLWERDVIELFLADDIEAGYQEFNLAPNGAWWTSAFEDYRSPRSTSGHYAVPLSISTHEADGRTRVLLAYPRSELRVSFSGTQNSHANLCAILGDESKTFLSYHRCSDRDPDFHLAECFGSVDISRRLSKKA